MRVGHIELIYGGLADFGQSSRHRRLYNIRGKRLFDLIVTVLALPFALPFLLVTAALARSDGGPSFYGHERIGMDGARFTCWKIRTMRVNSQRLLEEHLAQNPDAAEEWRRHYKLKDDPRITRWGKFLRRTSLDELPQLWNVARGEMSLVGPRPVVEDELTLYGENVSAYLACKPGITGIWQVSGRNDVSYEARVSMDVDYGQRQSLLLDLKILVLTVGAVVGLSGR